MYYKYLLKKLRKTMMGRKQYDIEPMDKHRSDPQKRLNNGHSTITCEAKHSSYISEESRMGLNSRTLKLLLKALAEMLSKSYITFRRH